ncbi:MAG: hypothetical protein V8S21_01335 [Lachnospira eligens]
MEFSEKKDYYDAAMRQIKGDSWMLKCISDILRVMKNGLVDMRIF